MEEHRVNGGWWMMQGTGNKVLRRAKRAQIISSENAHRIDVGGIINVSPDMISGASYPCDPSDPSERIQTSDSETEVE